MEKRVTSIYMIMLGILSKFVKNQITPGLLRTLVEV